MSQYKYNVNNELAETSVSSLVQPPHYEDLEFIEFYDNHPSDESVQRCFPVPSPQDVMLFNNERSSLKAWCKKARQHNSYNNHRNQWLQFATSTSVKDYLSLSCINKKLEKTLRTFFQGCDSHAQKYYEILMSNATDKSTEQDIEDEVARAHAAMYYILDCIWPNCIQPSLTLKPSVLNKRLTIRNKSESYLRAALETLDSKLVSFYRKFLVFVEDTIYRLAKQTKLHVGLTLPDATYSWYLKYIVDNMHFVDMQYILHKQYPHMLEMAFPHTEPFSGYDRERLTLEGRIYTIPTCSNSPGVEYFNYIDSLCKKNIHTRDCACRYTLISEIEAQAITCSTIDFTPRTHQRKPRTHKTANSEKLQQKEQEKKIAISRKVQRALKVAQCVGKDFDRIESQALYESSPSSSSVRFNSLTGNSGFVENDPFTNVVSEVTTYPDISEDIFALFAPPAEPAQPSFVSSLVDEVDPDVPDVAESAENLSVFARVLQFFSKVKECPSNIMSIINEYWGGLKGFYESLAKTVKTFVVEKIVKTVIEGVDWTTVGKISILLVIAVLGWQTEMMDVATIVLNALGYFMFPESSGFSYSLFASVAFVTTKYIVSQSDYFVPRPIVVAISMLGALVFGKFTAWTTPKVYDDFITRIDRQARAMTAVMTISERICWVFNKILTWIGLEHYGFSQDLTQVLPPDVEHYINEVKFFYDKDTLDRFVEDNKLCDRMSALFASIPMLQAKYAAVPILKRHIDAHVGFIHKAFSNASLVNPTLQRPRTEPVTIFLRGGAGVGKTKLVYRLAALACAEMGKINSKMSDEEIDDTISSNVYSRQIANEYWDGYHGQEVTVVDDFGQRVDSLSNPNDEYLEFIMAANSFAYPLHMANISQKAATFFKSSMYIATTNLNTIKPPSLIHPQAFHRRMHIAVEVCLKPQYRGQNGRLRPELDTGELLEDIHDFYIWNPATGEIASDNPLTFADLQCMIKAIYAKNKFKGKQEMTGTVKYARSLLLPESQADSESDAYASTEEDAEISTDKIQLIQFKLNFSQYLSEEELAIVERFGMFKQETVKPSPVAIVIQKARNMKDIMLERITAVFKKFKQLGYDIVKCFKYYSTLTFDLGMCFSYALFSAVKMGASTVKYTAFTFKVMAEYTIELAKDYWNSTKTWIQEAAAAFKKYVTSGWAKLLYCMVPVILCIIPGTRSLIARKTLDAAKYVGNRVKSFVSDPPKVVEPIIETVQHYTERPRNYIRHRFDDLVTTRSSGFSRHDNCRDCETIEQAQLNGYNFRDMVQMVMDEHDLTMDQALDFIDSHATAESSRGRSQKAPRKTLKRAVVRSHEPVAEAWLNDNSCSVSNKIEANLRTFRMGAFKCHALMIHGHTFVMNGHSVVHMEYLNDTQHLDITVHPPGGSAGTIIKFSDLEFSDPYPHLDIVIGRLPQRYFNQCPDLRRHIMKAEEINLIRGMTGVLLVPNETHIQQKHGMISDRRDIQVRDSDTVTYRTDALVVKMSTQKGDCGGCYMVDASMQRRIFGIHGAGMASGGVAYAIPIWAEMFEQITAQADYDEDQPPRHPLKRGGGNVTILGTKPQMFTPCKSAIVKTKVHNKIFETTCAPSALAPPLQEDGPMLKALEKQFGPVFRVEPERLIAARENYERKLSECVPDVKMGVLSFEVATRGIEGSDYYRGINRARSAGYPWCRETKRKGKTLWFGSEEWIYNEHTAKLEQHINESISKMENREIQSYIFMDTLKDETRPIEKVLAKKTRVFAAAPMDFIIVFRMYYLDFLVYMMRNRITNESAVGIKAQSDEWTILYNKLREKGDRVIAGDFSNYDGSLNPAILWAVYDVIEGFYARDGATEAEQNVRWCLWNNLVNSEHIVANIWYQLNHSQPSGNPSTAILNSMYNSIACRYVFYLIYSSKMDFNEYVSMIAYGDDNVLNVSELAPEYTQARMADGFSTFGMTYTDELKTGDLQDKLISEIAFLKRGFSYAAKARFCFSPLSLVSILEAFNWIKKTDSEPAVLQQIAENALVELSMHPKAVFSKYAKAIYDCMKESYNLNIIPRTYESYRQSIMTGKIFDEFPTLEWA